MYLPCWGGGGGWSVTPPTKKKSGKNPPKIKLDTFDILFFFLTENSFNSEFIICFIFFKFVEPNLDMRPRQSPSSPKKKETIIMNSWLVQPYTTYFLSHLNKVHSFFIIHRCACVTIWFYAVPPVGHLRLVHVWYLDFFKFQYHNIRTKPLSRTWYII